MYQPGNVNSGISKQEFRWHLLNTLNDMAISLRLAAHNLPTIPDDHADGVTGSVARIAEARTVRLTTPAGTATVKSPSWRSRYAGIERPDLVLTHDPGWVREDMSTGGDDTVHRIFSSTFAPLGITFDVLENDSSTVTFSIGSDLDRSVDTPGELLKLGESANAFTRWATDCATVVAWCHDHDTTVWG